MSRVDPQGDAGQPRAPRRAAADAPLFADTADPACYLRRAASERELARLAAAVLDGPGRAALIAPPGSGKTLLLRVLAERVLGRLATLYLPYGALPLDQLCAWALGLLGQTGTADPQRALRALAGRMRPARAGLLLLIDDASSIPLQTARALLSYLRESGGGLKLVLAGDEDARTSRVLAALDLDLGVCRRLGAFTQPDTRALITTALQRAEAGPALWARFDATTLARIHAISGGLPRPIQTLANAVARGGGGSVARLRGLLELPGTAAEVWEGEDELEVGAAPLVPAEGPGRDDFGPPVDRRPGSG